MYGRRNQRKRGFQRIAVMLLALVMLGGVCVPGLRASAEGEPDVTVTQGTSAGFTGVSGVLSIESVHTEANGLTLAPTGNGTITVTAATNATVGTHTVAVTYSVAAPVEDVAEAEDAVEGEDGATGEPLTEQKTISFTVKVEAAEPEEPEEPEETEKPEEPEELEEPEEPEELEETEEPEELEELEEPEEPEETEKPEEPKEQTLYEKLTSASTCQEVFNLLMAEENKTAVYTLMPTELGDLEEKVTEMDDDGYREDVLDTVTALMALQEETSDGGTAGSTYDWWGDNDKKQTSGTFNHIEIEVAATVAITIDGVPVTKQINITVDNTTYRDFTVTAKYKDGTDVSFQYTALTNGNGSNNGATVELSGSYPTGTKSNPAIYTISLVKDVTFSLSDGREITLPITLTVTVGYWDTINACPGLNQGKTDWGNGYFINGSGIDVPVQAEDIAVAITKGKLQIEKIVVDENGTAISDNGVFRFTLRHNDGDNKGLYANFTNNAYTGASGTATEITVTAGQSVTLTDLPVGQYRITELQSDGYVVTGGSDYTYDFTIENKTDSDVPIATFTNKKLTREAGVSIKKMASGLTSYPNPTVTIYEYTDGVKGNSVWSGSLTANGETLYLTDTLPAGTYIIEESGETVDGYNCATSLSGNATIDGMVFTVAAGNRYDLTVNNVYTEKPKTTSVTVNKLVSGNMGDWNKDFSFEMTIQVNGENFVPEVLPDGCTANDSGVLQFRLAHKGSITFSSTIPIGATITVTETAESSEGYQVFIEGSETESSDRTYSDTVPEGGLVIDYENNRNATIDTGIVSDSVPFILLFAVAAVGGGVLLMSKQRYSGKF